MYGSELINYIVQYLFMNHSPFNGVFLSQIFYAKSGGRNEGPALTPPPQFASSGSLRTGCMRATIQGTIHCGVSRGAQFRIGERRNSVLSFNLPSPKAEIDVSEIYPKMWGCGEFCYCK